MKGFGSDNHSGVHPAILEAILSANVEHAPSYGTDDLSQKACEMFQLILGKKVGVYFVFNGTAANVLSMRAMLKSYQSVLCTDISHLAVDECGSPEFLAGCKLVTLPSLHGKIQIEDLEKSLIRKGDQHFSQIRAISLTQPTEVGTCYTIQEIQDICTWAKRNQIFVHVDGARLHNAAVHLKTSFKEMLVDTGVDIVSWGGTKNGFLFGEAIVILNPELEKDFVYIRKQSAQLPSKTRFIAAQFLAALNSNVWREIATHSLAMARQLRSLVENIPGLQVTQATESNAVFACIPKEWVKQLRPSYFFYVMNEKNFECRWMASWDTSSAEIEGFAAELKKISAQTSVPSNLKTGE